MDDAILILRLEHKKMREVLTVFAGQLDEVERGDEPDIDLLETGLDYLVGYSNECHHPKEELIYHKLISHDKAVSGSLIDLEKEHTELRRITQNLADVVETCRVPEKTKHERLVVALRQFLDFYRHHMAMEEKHLFTVAPKRLSNTEWSEIEFSMFDQTDPLLRQRVDERYSALHEAVTQLAESHRRNREQREPPLLSEEQRERIDRLTTLVGFNADGEAIRAGARLTRSPDGGYGLVLRREKRVVDIPECSEQRAVWCALYFLEGLQTMPISLEAERQGATQHE